MANTKITALPAAAGAALTQLFEVVTDPSGSPISEKLSVSQLFNLLIPTGFVAMWSGTIATIPTGWALCNGSNGTPDLRDKFVVGARQDDGGVAKTNILGSLTVTGGNINHTHDITDPGHTHSTPITLDAGADFQNVGAAFAATGNGTSSNEVTGVLTDPSDPNESLPPFYALALIMKL